MKKTLLLFLIFKISIAFSQVDTCHIDSLVRNLYYYDAIDLTIDTVNSNTSHPYYDSIHLPYTQVNKILKDLGMVYYLSCPERDSVVTLYNIHYASPSYVPYIRNEILIWVDTNYLWVKQFIQDSIISGNITFDSLVANNKFKLLYYSPYFERFTVATDSTYNLSPIINKLITIPGVTNAQEPPIIGDGDHIIYHSLALYDELIFSHGWGDCPAGCIYRCFWMFYIYPDCSSVFVIRWGDNPSLENILTNVFPDNEIIIYPSPSNDFINISSSTPINRIEIFDMYGNLVKNINVNNNSISVIDIASGIYTMNIFGTDNNILTKKRFIKIH